MLGPLCLLVGRHCAPNATINSRPKEYFMQYVMRNIFINNVKSTNQLRVLLYITTLHYTAVQLNIYKLVWHCVC